MIDQELSNLNEVNYTHIEDIIDARKELGQYNVNKQPSSINYRYVYSTSTGTNERFVRFNDLLIDGDPAQNTLKHTDSEITVVRLKQDNMSMKKPQINMNKWDMHDVAIPGDGSHLGESPSLVNLATLVAQNLPSEGDEYLVPLSSWDPYIKTEENTTSSQERKLKYMSELSIQQEEQPDPDNNSTHDNKSTTGGSPDVPESDFRTSSNSLDRRSSLAGRISKFLRRHYKRSKTLPDLQLDKK